MTMTGILEFAARSPWTAAWLDATFQTLVLLSLAGLASLVLRRASAAARHLVWTLALGSTLVLPLLAPFVPALTRPLLVPVEARDIAISPVRTASAPASPSPSENRAARVPARTAGGRSATARDVAGPSPAPAATTLPAVRSFRPTPAMLRDWPGWVFVAWALGVGVALASLPAGLIGLATMRRRSSPIDDREWLDLVQQLGTRLGLRRAVALRRSDATLIPMTWGWLRPVVLLPRGADSWPLERRTCVLLHELAHVKRLDCLTQQMAQLACALHWHNPLAWLAAYRMRLEREQASDDCVLLAGSRPSDYAGHLLELASALRSTPASRTPLAAVAMARSTKLAGRLHAILDAGHCRRSLSRKTAALGLLAVMVLVVPLSALRITARADEVKTLAPQPAPPSGSALENTEVATPSIIVNGRVLDPDGAPVPLAQVAVVDQASRISDNDPGESPIKTVAIGRADEAGRFALKWNCDPPHLFPNYIAFAKGTKHGFGIKGLKPDLDHQEVTIKLTRDQIIRGRLIDLQGQPASRVKVEVIAFGDETASADALLYSEAPPTHLPLWPGPVTSDDQGRYTLSGIGQVEGVVLRVREEPYAIQALVLETGKAGAVYEVTKSLAPARILEGQVTRADDGVPVPNARLVVFKGSRHGWAPPGITVETNAQGRYRVSIPPPEGENEEYINHYVLWSYLFERHALPGDQQGADMARWKAASHA